MPRALNKRKVHNEYGQCAKHRRHHAMKMPETNSFERAAGVSSPRLRGRILVSIVTLALLFAMWPQNLAAYQDAQSAGAQPAQARSYPQQSVEQLQQMVAPIALYPD